jgi:capsular exopolysaccharide synthesis family protein
LSRFHDAMTRKQQTEPQLGGEEPQRRDHRVTILPLRDARPTVGEAQPKESEAVVVEPDAPLFIEVATPHPVDENRRDREHWPTSHAQSASHPAYERIIQRLLSHRRAKRENVILVVSAVAGEGASTVSRSLASAIGINQSERAVLVDANLRTPRQHEALGVARSEGLSDVVTGAASLTGAVKTGFDSNVSLLTCGSPNDSPPHVLSSSAFHSLVAALQAEFDWVIVDGPPVTAYPDAASIASACGGAVLVLRAERTRWEVAEEAKRVLENSGAEVLGAVLNRRKYHIPWFIYKRL